MFERVSATVGGAFEGQVVKEASALINKAAHSATLVEGEFMKQPGQKSPHTFLFRFQTRDSEGKPNGVFLAYADQRIFDSHSSDGPRDVQ